MTTTQRNVPVDALPFINRMVCGAPSSYYRARYYDPASGRFLSEDPLGGFSGAIDFYQYVNNNPLGAKDPFGLCASSDGLSQSCSDALKAAGADRSGLQRAMSRMSTFRAVGNANGVPANILAAISLRESDAIEGRIGDHGHGHGAFQIDDRYHPLEAATIATDFDLAANFAAGLLGSAYGTYSLQTNPQTAMAAAIRDYNASSEMTRRLLAMGGSLDTKTAGPGGGNYVSNVLAIAANCFP